MYPNFNFYFMFNTPYKFVLEDSMMEHNNEPSLTVPDMSYSIKEILQRFTSGQPLPIDQGLSFDDESDFDDDYLPPDRTEGGFDLSDIPILRAELQRLEELQIENDKSRQNDSDAGTVVPGDT